MRNGSGFSQVRRVSKANPARHVEQFDDTQFALANVSGVKNCELRIIQDENLTLDKI